MVLSLWLVVTVTVAFLREAKAVRVSRKLLAENRAQEAWSLLDPFLKDHPRHRQGLLLCGQATIRLSLRAEAKQCLATLGEESPELAKQLGEDYRQVLTAQVRAQGCSVTNFESLLGWAEELGDPYPASVTAGLDGVVDACRTARNEYEPWRFVSVLGKKGKAVEMVNKGYVPAIGRALTQARYGDAKVLAQQAVRLVPDGASAVAAVLNAERGKVTATVGTLRQLCTSLASDARYHPGSSWCFPAAAPPAVQAAKDGWGRGALYSPLNPAGTPGCYQGFDVISYGGDGQPTANDRQSPAADITCRFIAGAESWKLPGEYWQERGD